MDFKRLVHTLTPRSIRNWREARHFLKYGEIEMHLVDLLCRRREDAIDVGAHWGGYVHFMRRHARRVIAFEPIPELCVLMREKFPDVEVWQFALSDHTGIADLFVPVIDGRPVAGLSTLSPSAAKSYPQQETIRVRCSSLDTLYQGDVGFIKIDVAGHEQPVLEGALRTIRRCRPRLLVEIDQHLVPGSVERMTQAFERLDYAGFYIRFNAGGHHYELRPIDSFSIELQDPDRRPAWTDTVRDRQEKEFINNFLFLPLGEPGRLLESVEERLREVAPP